MCIITESYIYVQAYFHVSIKIMSPLQRGRLDKTSFINDKKTNQYKLLMLRC